VHLAAVLRAAQQELESQDLGELGENPRGHTRRVRQRIFGVVVCASGEHKYNARFESDTEQVCFSTSLRVESHDIGVRLEEVKPSLPMAQQEEAQGDVEDAEEEEEENDFLDILAGVDDDAIHADCNIKNDQYDDQSDGQPLAEHATAATVVAATVVTAAIAAATTTTTTEEDAAVPADDVEEDYSTTVENPGLNTGGGTAEGGSHVQKLQHWKQKTEDMRGTSVEIKSKNPVVTRQSAMARLKDRTWALKILTTTISHVMKYVLLFSSI
jgi:hypothetical protein